ncbi:hypothetical protein C8N26_1986 [Tenacibaculum lutimaris]|uniref:Fibronectin type-III domain-containing protein n=1 Tax=Tenacibaculum lutimaris TaxID=285258 RepID=A0A420E0H1_9FLAO|nr:hypothetical protein [Tenacibaculum lutimaris]RKF03596.1 hypothetical protein C8N26_1986 [Tenacibaculum lutimaris]
MNLSKLKYRLKQALFFYCLLLVVGVYAQRYPVQVTQTIIPPYSTKLSDYATASDVKFRLNLLLTDVVANNKQVRLKLRIKGNGFDIQSTDFVAGASQVILNGGVLQQFTNIDLAAYFQPNNLIGISPQQYNKPLPEGMYSFCWEVYDAYTNQQLNHPTAGCSNVYLLLNDPPFLNLPYKGDQIVAQDPMNIIFQWTPRHMNATNVSYEFELRELWDTQINPQAAFLASPNYYSETTYTTTLLYNIGKPTLLPNRRYGWRVKAKSTTGVSENSIFKNEGYSEIYYFTYTNACYPPTFVLSEVVAKDRVKLTWQGHPDHKKYHVQYKRADIPDAEWFEIYTYNTQAQISNLRAGKTYMFRVGGTCNELTDFDQNYSYSHMSQFTMPAKDEMGSSYNCGIIPEIQIDNNDPLKNIGINETFTAGDFPVTVKQVQGGNGTFTGVGYIVVPYLGDTKIAVTFDAISINTDYQLIEGVVKTTYDPTWGDVESVDAVVEDISNLIDEIENVVSTLFENGKISEEEKEDALTQLNEATTNLQAAEEQQNQADEIKQQAEKAESPEKEKLQEEAEKLEKESKETQQQVSKALKELQEKFGVKGKEGSLEIKTDAFFDGIISYGEGKTIITHKRLDGNGEISINTTDPNNNIPDASDYNFTHNGKQYNIIVTHSNSTIEAINEAKEKAVSPSTGIIIYFHYDLKNENLGYTVNFARDYFDNLPNKDFLEVQQLHKEALLNLLKQEQSSEDIINVIYNNVLEINTLFQEALNKIQLPEAIWNPDAENYASNEFHFEPLEAGLIDGAIEEIKSIPLLISLAVDYSTNPKTREKINKAFSDFDFTEAMKKWYESRKNLYTTETIHKIEHQTGKDVVEVGTLIGTGGLATLGKIKKGADFVEGLASAVKKFTPTSANLTEFLAKNLSKKLDDIAEAWKAYYPQIFFERKLFEDIMGHFRYKKADGWKHTSDISKNFEAIDFYKVASELEDKIFASVVVSMKTTTVTDVNKWLKHAAIKKNINELKREFGVEKGFTGKGKTIIYDKAEIHIYFPKEKFTDVLKNTWGKVLKQKHPEIKFNLSSLEEYIK